MLYAAANLSDIRHETALSIVRAADRGTLPILHVPNVVLVETMNGLTRDVGHATATEFLQRLRKCTQFNVAREPMAVWERGIQLFEEVDRLSLADALIVAGARHHGRDDLHSFGADFDGFDGFCRLDSTIDPFAP